MCPDLSSVEEGVEELSKKRCVRGVSSQTLAWLPALTHGSTPLRSAVIWGKCLCSSVPPFLICQWGWLQYLPQRVLAL